jgi:CBS domain-containing protein
MQTRSMHEIVRNQKPLTLPPTATVKKACEAMHARRVGAVLVVEHGDRLAGIFTGRDAVRLLAEGVDAAHTKLAAVMTRNPVTIAPEQNAIEALRLLGDCGFRHLPVVQDGHVVGIVSRYDFRAMEQGRMDEETGYFEVLR